MGNLTTQYRGYHIIHVVVNETGQLVLLRMKKCSQPNMGLSHVFSCKVMKLQVKKQGGEHGSMTTHGRPVIRWTKQEKGAAHSQA
jgi:hypothetical protein